MKDDKSLNLDVLKSAGNIKSQDLKLISGRQSIRYKKKIIMKEMKKNTPDLEKHLKAYLEEVFSNLETRKYIPTE